MKLLLYHQEIQLTLKSYRFHQKLLMETLNLKVFFLPELYFYEDFDFHLSWQMKNQLIGYLKKPSTNNLDPNELSILDVTETTLLNLSTIEK